MSRLELKIPPAALWLAAAGSTGLLAKAIPHLSFEFRGDGIMAIVVAFAGGALALAGVIEFRRSNTSVNPLDPNRASSLVTTGVYRYTRNPMYLGMATALLGVTLWVGTLWGIFVIFLFCIYLTRFQIMPEERLLEQKFGQEFHAYCARVRRWL
jgi:protein-S-isoprenylcysteine O-methyltransferase Ste14